MNFRWKDAATVIIVARNPLNKTCSSKISAFDRGGHTENPDGSQEWLDLYNQFGVNLSAVDKLNTEVLGIKNENIFHSNSTGQVSRLISLKISAIRETFEESGLLLCKQSTLGRSENADNWCSYLVDHETKIWQTKVQNNPSEFINACRYFQCYPDIWSLRKWSNWLTPASFSKRFNTAFFLTTIHRIPPTCIDNNEVTEVKWLTPDEVQQLAEAGDITLPIPQLYEVARLQNFQSVESLHHFAGLRDIYPIPRWMSVHVACNDGMIFLLPGDELYPEQEDLEERRKVETLQGTVDELRTQAMRLNRLESSGTWWRVVSNLRSDLATGCIYPRPYLLPTKL